MPEQPSRPTTRAEVQARLQQLAERLREADHLEPQQQEALADLVDELAGVIGEAPATSPETTHLAEQTAQLVHGIDQKHGEGLLASARERLEEAVIRAENEAPLAAGIARRIIDVLVNLGI